ncbi:MAG: hypothetical protein R6U96_10760, partial [Promethearchaeia archaeon]
MAEKKYTVAEKYLIWKVSHHLAYKSRHDLTKKTIMKGIAIMLKHHIALKPLIKKMEKKPQIQKVIFNK